jgi:hypothetical protein
MEVTGEAPHRLPRTAFREPATAISIGRASSGDGCTTISMGSIVDSSCAARVSRDSVLDHHARVDGASPSCVANSRPVSPLRRHRDTVFDHHSRDLRSFLMRAMGGQRRVTLQVRARSDGYSPTAREPRNPSPAAAAIEGAVALGRFDEARGDAVLGELDTLAAMLTRLGGFSR